MKFSRNGIDFLKLLESCKLKPYDDQTGNPIATWCKGATIGYGHLIQFDEWPKFKGGILHAEANLLLEQETDEKQKVVDRLITVELNQNQFDAACILAFNIGLHAFESSSVLMWINGTGTQSNFSSLESAWKAWNKSQGKVMKGLINRREAEWNLWNA